MTVEVDRRRLRECAQNIIFDYISDICPVHPKAEQ
jgi:hypothetical protein